MEAHDNGDSTAVVVDEAVPRENDPGRLMRIAIDLIDPNSNQPRKYFDSEKLEFLALSIRQHGQLQPIAVMQAADSDRYTIVAGERRYRAHKSLELETINCVLVSGDPEELALIENLQRENLNPIEIAEALARLQTARRYTQEELAGVIGKSRTSIAELLRLNMLPASVRDECRTRDVGAAMLLQLVRTSGESEQRRLWQKMVDGQVKTVREAKAHRKQGFGAGGARRLTGAAQVVADGLRFVRALARVSDDELLSHDGDYDALVGVARQLEERLEQVSQKSSTLRHKPRQESGSHMGLGVG